MGAVRVAQQKQDNTGKLVTSEEVAQALSYHRETIRLMARRGEIPCYKLGRQYRFDLDEVKKVLLRRRK